MLRWNLEFDVMLAFITVLGLSNSVEKKFSAFCVTAFCFSECGYVFII